MKVLGLILLLGFVVCDEKHYYHQSGIMDVDNKRGNIFGVVIVELLKDVNLTHLAGMYVVDKVHIPFHISGKFTRIRKESNDYFEINITAYEGSFGGRNLKKLTGGGLLAGSWEKADYFGRYHAEGNNLLFNFSTNGKKHPCEYYTMEEAARRAAYLVGESHSTYKNNHLLNHAVFGFSYLKTTCKDYLYNVGTATKEEKPGAVIVGNDGNYCAIIDHEGNKFIHSDSNKKMIIMTPMVLLKNYFRNGYTIKEYKCATHN